MICKYVEVDVKVVVPPTFDPANSIVFCVLCTFAH